MPGIPYDPGNFDTRSLPQAGIRLPHKLAAKRPQKAPSNEINFLSILSLDY